MNAQPGYYRAPQSTTGSEQGQGVLEGVEAVRQLIDGISNEGSWCVWKSKEVNCRQQDPLAVKMHYWCMLSGRVNDDGLDR